LIGLSSSKERGKGRLADELFCGNYEEKLKEWAWSSVAYLPFLEGEGGVWYMSVHESSPVRWMKDVRARYPAWDDLDDIAWDTATVIIHSVWTGLTGQGEQDTGHCYFATDKGYISGELRLSSLPLGHPEDLDMVTVRVVAIGYSSETQQYLYDEKVASIDV